MGVFDPIFSLFGDLGTGFFKLLDAPNAVYGLYLVAIFAGIYSIVHLIANRGGMRGRTAGVVSFMFSTIIVGSIFFGTNKNIEGLVGSINSLGKMLLFAVVSVGVGYGSIHMYRSARANNPESRTANLYLFGGLFVTCMLLTPVFADKSFLIEKVFNLDNNNSYGQFLGLLKIIFGILFVWNIGGFIWGTARGVNANVRVPREVSPNTEIQNINRDLNQCINNGEDIFNRLEGLI